MSSINDHLLDELLIIIFGNLTQDDRKTCRLVCQHWNDLILNEVKFRTDWHLYVDHSTLTPGDFELLLQSRVEFSSITLDLSNTFEHFDLLLNVLMQIGKSVNKIVIKKFPTEHCHRIINSLPLLKWIEIDSELNLKCINRNTTVEHLKLTYFHYFPSNILDLFEVFPKIQSLDYDRYILNDYICMIKSFRTAPTLWKVFYWVDGAPRFDEFQTEFLQFEKLNLDCFRYYYSSANEHKFDFLKKVISKFPDISKIELPASSSTVPPTEIQHKVTLLNASLQDEDFTFSILKNFKSLQQLEIHFYRGKCPTGHKIFTNTSLKALVLEEHEFYCEECWNTLIVSFPNLESLRLETPVSYDKLIKAVSHWKNLKCLELFTDQQNYRDLERFAPVPSCTSMLENLHCIINPVCMFEDLLDFIKCLPELKYLEVGNESPVFILTMADAKKVADTLVTCCKKLREFSIELDENQYEIKEEIRDMTGTLFINHEKLRKVKFCKETFYKADFL